MSIDTGEVEVADPILSRPPRPGDIRNAPDALVEIERPAPAAFSGSRRPAAARG